MVETAVLFETFVRVEYARQVWKAIKEVQPKKLYFYSNKGRAEKEGEVERNNEIRSWVNEVNWDCDLHTWFREECVDVYTSLRGAIDWVYSNEEAAIVLEDDVVPTEAFFSFCDQMIAKFKDDKNVWCISGDNFRNYHKGDYDYYFSQYHFMYGHASWRDRWQKIMWDNYPIPEILSSHMLDDMYLTKKQVKNREKQLKRIHPFLTKTNCWDLAFGVTIDYNHGMTVHPKEHLITCVGMQGTHSNVVRKTQFQTTACPTYTQYTIVKDQEKVEVNKDFDYDFFLLYEKYMRLSNRIFRKLESYIYGFIKSLTK